MKKLGLLLIILGGILISLSFPDLSNVINFTLKVIGGIVGVSGLILFFRKSK